MACSIDDIRSWFEEHKAKGDDYMLVVVDTFDYEDYPVGVRASDFEVKRDYYRNAEMQRIMEVYDLSMTFDEQSSGRVWNGPNGN